VRVEDADRVSSRRIVILAGAAAMAGLAAVVGACGRPGGRPEAVAAPSPATTDQCGQAIAPTSDIPVGGGAVFSDRRVVVTQPSPGEFRGFGIVCTHDGCELDRVTDGTINCPCHGSRYSIVDGSVVQGPARSGLRTETVSVENGCVVLL
jgi:Rieske Fe-S protein